MNSQIKWIPLIIIAIAYLSVLFYEDWTGNLEVAVSSIHKFSALETTRLYLFLNISIIALPVLFSFDKKIAYYKRWKFLFPAIILTMCIFIPWDIAFTKLGVWGFNSTYFLEATSLAGLPLGEWLFFITVPYACIFIYDAVKAYFKESILLKDARIISGILMLTFILIAGVNYHKIYTVSAACLSLILIYIHEVIFRSGFMTQFYVAFAISLIPFLIFNGILTGAFTDSPLVIYNNAENLGLRLGSIPVDDLIYSFALLLTATSFYELFQRGKSLSKIT